MHCRLRRSVRFIGLLVGLGAFVAATGCKCESGEGPRAPGAAEAPAPAPPEMPPEEAPVAPAVPIPDGPAVAAPLLRERPSEAECAAACDRIMAAETTPWIDGAPPDARPEITAVLDDLRARQRPACVRRCRAELSRAVTECVRRTDDVAAAVDCLTRTGAVGPREP